MTKKPPPAKKPPRTKCPPHVWKFPAKTNGDIEHECKKCGTKTKRPKGKGRADGAGWGGGT